MRDLWRNYSLGIVYVVGWLLALALHAHGEWWSSQYTPVEALPWGVSWYTSFWENVQSEMFQVGFFVIAATYLIYKGSPQSRDGTDRIEALLRRLADPEDQREGDTHGR